MRLINAILRPGVVVEDIGSGKIKASSPGLFSSKDKDSLPPIYPFFDMIGSHCNSFSSPIVGEEVWILNCTDNPLQLYWFRKDNVSSTINNMMEELDVWPDKNVEVFCARESGLGWATLMFSDGTGWILRNGDSHLRINKDGDIELGVVDDPTRKILINNGAIHLGSGEEHPGCFGDKTAEILDNICDIILQASKSVAANPYTAPLSNILSQISSIQPEIQKIKSEHVKLI